MRLVELYASTHLSVEECFEASQVDHPEDLALQGALRQLRLLPRFQCVVSDQALSTLLAIKDPRLQALFASALMRLSRTQGSYLGTAQSLRRFLLHLKRDALPFEFQALWDMALADPGDSYAFQRILETCVRNGPRESPRLANWFLSLGYSLALEGRLHWLETYRPSLDPHLSRMDQEFIRRGHDVNVYINHIESHRVPEAMAMERRVGQGLTPLMREGYAIYQMKLRALMDPHEPPAVSPGAPLAMQYGAHLCKIMQALMAGKVDKAAVLLTEPWTGFQVNFLALTTLLAKADVERARTIAAVISPGSHEPFRRVLKARALWLCGETAFSQTEYEEALQAASDHGSLSGALFQARLCGLEGSGHLRRATDARDFSPRPLDTGPPLWGSSSDPLRSQSWAHLLRGGSSPLPPAVEESALTPGLRRQVEAFARTGDGILLEGETGTGKSHLARHIHERSGGGEFLTVSCAGLQGDLLSSELFGHVRGAFTGAVAARKGLFEEAGDGTVLLEDLQDAPLPVQAALLKVLEAREVRPVGSSRSSKIRCRINATTTKPLALLVSEGLFREDLRHRLERFVLRLPPLRERRKEIRSLVRRILADIGLEDLPVSEEQMRAWQAAAWKGNLRELRNTLEQWGAFASGVVADAREPIPAVPAGGHPGFEEASHRLSAGRPAQVSRRTLMLELLRRRGPLSPKNLSKALEVTVPTVLSDLKALKARGLAIKREHSHLYEAGGVESP